MLTFVYMLAEAVGGWLTNSLALIADAGHMLTDVAALSLTLGAIWFASRPATARKTFGYYRLEILAAFVNGIALVLLSIWVIYEAFIRWQAPPEVNGIQLTFIAAGGLLVNIVAAKLLHADHKHDLNMRGAWLHVMGDLLGSVTAIVAGVPSSKTLTDTLIKFHAPKMIIKLIKILIAASAHIQPNVRIKIPAPIAAKEPSKSPITCSHAPRKLRSCA